MHPTRMPLWLPVVFLAGAVLSPHARAQGEVVREKPVLQDVETKKPAAKPEANQGPSFEDKCALVDALFRGDRKKLGEVIPKFSHDVSFLGAVSVTAGKVTDAAVAGKGADEVSDDVKTKVAKTLTDILASGKLQELPADAGTVASKMMAKFRKNLDSLRVMAIRSGIRAGLASQAVYAGQYKALTRLGPDVHDLMCKMIDNPPSGVDDFQRQALVGALRDVTKTLSKEQMKLLGEIADDDFEDPQVQQKASYVLAFYGDRTRLSKAIANFEKDAKSESDQERAQALIGLASLYHDIRDYKKAVECYDQLFAKLPENLPQRNVATLRYNMCCSQALSGDLDGAFASLDKALTLGAETLADSLLARDHDINALRKDPRFKALLEKHNRLQKNTGGADK